MKKKFWKQKRQHENEEEKKLLENYENWIIRRFSSGKIHNTKVYFTRYKLLSKFRSIKKII